MKDWVLISLVVTGAFVAIVTAVIGLYLVAIYAHVSGFIFDFNRNWVNKGIIMSIGAEFRKDPF